MSRYIWPYELFIGIVSGYMRAYVLPLHCANSTDSQAQTDTHTHNHTQAHTERDDENVTSVATI